MISVHTNIKKLELDIKHILETNKNLKKSEIENLLNIYPNEEMGFEHQVISKALFEQLKSVIKLNTHNFMELLNHFDLLQKWTEQDYLTNCVGEQINSENQLFEKL
ncbi:hypothetical protein [Brumimicrobium oceani]|uniref:Uncharacterized protein n=1 Tax=Brumimicrobium oceani TaxID=2100725 RepID=A0A2U2XG99_9FLAO|nr:hypothetical protein [Brumimicrobium oceani]PWH86815.1 hypothetical protein DIT68_00705 [Brumimicrobium oceani]